MERSSGSMHGIVNRRRAAAWILAAIVMSWAASRDVRADDPSSPATPPPDETPHSSFLRWVHVDGLWLPGESDAGVFGLVGMHIAVARIGRTAIFGPPGVMLVRQQTANGPIIRALFTWGMSYRLTDMHVPHKSRPASLYLSLAKCWTSVNIDDGIAMFGLSITWER
jgi:hypothetical protein